MRIPDFPISTQGSMMKRFLILLVALLFSGLSLAAVNINTATLQELEALNGIGPVKAQAIIDHRKANGPFKSIDQIKDVKGVGDATFDKIKGDLAVSGATKAPAATPAAAAAAKAEPAKAAAPAAPAPAMKAEPAKAATPATPATAPAMKADTTKDKAVADKAAKEKTAADKTAATKAAKDKAAADKAVAEKAAKDKAAADKAAADKAKKP